MRIIVVIVTLSIGAVRLLGSPLCAGDLAVVAYNTDYTDSFAWVAFRDIPPNTLIHFTNSSVSNGWFRWGDHLGRTVSPGPLTWTSPNLLKEGTVVTWIAGTQKCWSVGILSGGGMTLSAEGDQIFAYTGKINHNVAGTSPWLGDASDAVMLFGLNFANGGWDNVTGGASRSYIPSGLSSGDHTAVHAGKWDNGYYSGIRTGTVSKLLRSIDSLAKWTSSSDYISPGQWPTFFLIEPPRGTLISVE